MNQTQTDHKHIIVLGGGFGGMVSIFELLKKLPADGYQITLIDRNDYHFYYPNTYEVATAEEDFSNLLELKSTIAFPYATLLPKRVRFVHGEVSIIDRAAHTVTVGTETMLFDYCIVAMGSEAAYYGIPGLKEHALNMKSFNDAVLYRNALEQVAQMRSGQMTEAPVRVVVGGGGFTGVEIASETVNLLCLLAEKFGYNYDKYEVMVVDANPTILFGQAEEVVDSVTRRMKHLQIPIIMRTSAAIQKADEKSITLADGEVIDYDVFVWTGGVQAVPVPFVQPEGVAVVLDKRGRIQVNANLVVADAPSVVASGAPRVMFAIGDNAVVLDANGRPLAQTAQQAIAQGVYVAESIVKLESAVKSKTAVQLSDIQKPFKAQAQPFIVPVCGKWAVVRFPNGFTMYGFIPWLMHNYATFRYLKRLMPVFTAARVTWFGMKVYTRNDM